MINAMRFLLMTNQYRRMTEIIARLIVNSKRVFANWRQLRYQQV